MYRIACTVALGLGLAALVGASPAQAFPAERLTAHVPFAFDVRGVTLPAGDYTISQPDMNEQGLLLIRSQNGRHAAYFYIDDVSTPAHSSAPELLFDRYGKLDFLRRIRVPNEGTARMTAPPQEITAARRMAYATSATPTALASR